jgi:NAD(P)-dependent dehydrogenase (short-subunit alcohol dehydrogenase family)
VVADILGNEAEAVAADIRAGGGEAIAATIDVTSEPEWGPLIGKTLASYGRLDVLVNNAGISGSSVGDPDGLEGWHRIIAVNQTSVFLDPRMPPTNARNGVLRNRLDDLRSHLSEAARGRHLRRGPRVCRLFAGGSRIRTLGPA